MKSARYPIARLPVSQRPLPVRDLNDVNADQTLEALISRLGVTVPIIVYNGHVLDGMRRLRAAAAVGATHLPAVHPATWEEALDALRDSRLRPVIAGEGGRACTLLDDALIAWRTRLALDDEIRAARRNNTTSIATAGSLGVPTWQEALASVFGQPPAVLLGAYRLYRRRVEYALAYTEDSKDIDEAFERLFAAIRDHDSGRHSLRRIAGRIPRLVDAWRRTHTLNPHATLEFIPRREGAMPADGSAPKTLGPVDPTLVVGGGHDTPSTPKAVREGDAAVAALRGRIDAVVEQINLFADSGRRPPVHAVELEALMFALRRLQRTCASSAYLFNLERPSWAGPPLPSTSHTPEENQ